MIIEDEELRSLYKVSSSEHIQKIEAGILHLEKHPQDTAKLEELLREAHSLKGDSRMLGVVDVETLIHQIEEIFTSAKKGETNLTPDLCDRLYRGIDAVGKIAREAVTGEPSNVKVFQTLAELMGAVDMGAATAPQQCQPPCQLICQHKPIANSLTCLPSSKVSKKMPLLPKPLRRLYRSQRPKTRRALRLMATKSTH